MSIKDSGYEQQDGEFQRPNGIWRVTVDGSDTQQLASSGNVPSARIWFAGAPQNDWAKVSRDGKWYVVQGENGSLYYGGVDGGELKVVLGAYNGFVDVVGWTRGRVA